LLILFWLCNTKFFSFSQSYKLVIPVNIGHAVFCYEHAVEPEADVESSDEEEQQPEYITLSTHNINDMTHIHIHIHIHIIRVKDSG